MIYLIIGFFAALLIGAGIVIWKADFTVGDVLRIQHPGLFQDWD